MPKKNTAPSGSGPRLPEAVEHWAIDRVIPYAHNARTHTPEQVGEIAGSIREFGWTNPVLVDEAGDIIAGHGRVLAAHQLHMPVVPVIVLDYLSAAQKRALRLADNRIAINSGWNEELLSLELRELAEGGYDVAGLGFAEDELTRLLAQVTGGNTDPDASPNPPEVPVSAIGDVWLLGRHRLVCGDSTDPEVARICFAGVEPVLMITDPPYGVEYDPEWRAVISGRGKLARGKVQNDDNASWIKAYRNFPGPVAYVWHASRFASVVERDLKDERCEASDGEPHAYKKGRCHRCGARVGMEIRAQIIWAKSRLIISRGHYHWQHEPCWYAVRNGSTASWHGDRKQSTLWQINTQVNDTGHGTQKPVECMSRPIANHTNTGQSVFDPFVGSGTTIIACEQTARTCYAIDIDPKYVDVALKRWEAFTGQRATLEANGRMFADVAAERGVEVA